MFKDTPAPFGATKGFSRDEVEGKGAAYVFRPYPSVRFHPDGRTVEVADPAADKALGEPWSKKPYPPAPVVIPPPEPTAAELKAKIAELVAMNSDLATANAFLTDGLAKAQTAFEGAQAWAAKKDMELTELRAKKARASNLGTSGRQE